MMVHCNCPVESKMVLQQHRQHAERHKKLWGQRKKMMLLGRCKLAEQLRKLLLGLEIGVLEQNLESIRNMQRKQIQLQQLLKQ